MQRTIRLLLVAVLSGSGLAAIAAPPVAHEPEITTPGAAGAYLRRVHERFHGRYTQEFIRTVASTYPANHPLNDLKRQATVALTVRWDGTIADAVVKKASGSVEFDRAAVDVARKSAPLPLPPQEVVSDDSYAHIEWTFARDHRACAAGAQISRVDDPLDVSLPRLIRANRVGEALRRVGESAKAGAGAGDGGGGAGLDRFARLYLSRTTPDPVLDVAAAVALAEAGDRTQAARLREALGSRPTVDMAVRGLHKLGLDVCEAVRQPMQGGSTLARETAIAAVRTAATIGSNISTCQPALAAIVSDGHAPTALRLLALDALLTFAPNAARPVVLSTMQDRDPAVRGAAILASVRKGGGRPEMYRLAPLLHDKAVEVRGAASAGMVRAGGDQALEQLYLLARETDARPGTLVAAELAHMSTHASAEFLGKMLKRNNFAVQVAAARALAARKDAGARAELDAVKTDANVPTDVRAIATGQAKPEPRAGQGGQPPTMVASTATAPLRQLLKEHRDREAAGWIIEKLLSLEPRDAIDVLGMWLVRAPGTPAADGAPRAPVPPAATTAPKTATPTTSALAL